MERKALVNLIVESVRDYLAEIEEGEVPAITEQTSLFGKEGVLDSVGLVSVTLEVERLLGEQHGISVSIANERAMSQTNSPFVTVGAIADYVLELAAEES